jgi:membrane fusion protein, multidrug efflux system
LWYFHAAKKPPAHAVQAEPVDAAQIVAGDLPDEVSGIGSVTPLATVTVTTQINGQLMSVGYREGQIVQKGDFLAQIDPRPFQVALQLAMATLEHDSEVLAQAKSDLVRFETLGRQDSIAQQQVADQRFLVKQDEGTVAEDQANIASDNLNLTYCHIVAPVTGRVGLRLVDAGNYVQTSTGTGLVVLTQLQPISVVFVLPQSDVPLAWQNGEGGVGLQVTAFDGGNAKQLDAGTLTSVDNEMDSTTGTVKLRATFPNEKYSLFPNEFVNAHLLLNTLHNVTLAPIAAIQHGAPGTFVYVVKPDNTVAVQAVTTGVSTAEQVQILTGLKPGDIVVTDGVDRLQNGAKVQITPNAAKQASTVNSGPGSPPGQQPTNSTPVPQGQQAGQKAGQQAQPNTAQPSGGK